jgi:hypothetical protein
MGVSIMFTKITTILAASLLLGGCMSSQPKESNDATPTNKTAGTTKKEQTKFVQLSMIKLYAQSNVDSSIILDKVNKELAKGKTVDAVLSSYGTYFTDIKIDVGTLSNSDTNFAATNTMAHVAKITPTELVPGQYTTGVTGTFNVKQFDDSTKYIFNYKIKNAVLRKMDVSPTNKLITTPDIKVKSFEQSLVLEDDFNMATGITNPEPKQYEMFIVKVSTKKE